MRRLWNLGQQLRAERWPMERLHGFQMTRLKGLLELSYARVPFYRRLMDANGVRPEHIRSLNDMHRLPMVDKHIMRRTPESKRVSRPCGDHRGKVAEGVTRIRTSGSSGEPFGFLVDTAFNQWRKAQCIRPYLSNGRRPFRRLLHVCAVPGAPVSLPVRLGLLPEVRLSSTTPASEQIRVLQTLKPHYLQGYASSLRALAMEVRRTGARIPPLQRVFSDSEVLTDTTRALLVSTLKAPVVNVYGSFEADNIAYECGHHQGLHLAMDSVIAEVVDAQGRILPPGEEGELVITLLHNRLMPFIRYRTGDAVRLLSDPCGCGRSFPLMQLMGGRCVDMLQLADGGRASPGGLIRHFEEDGVEILEFKITQTAVRRFSINVVPAGRIAAGVMVDRVRGLIHREIPDAQVDVELMDRIPRTAAGKLPVFSCRMDGL